MTQPILQFTLLVFYLFYCNIFFLECDVNIVLIQKYKTADIDVKIIREMLK
jgi:hypothetical protein